MTQTKTKKALLMSVLSMVLCVAMLVGMTFAWFTDTASTGVNKIQAGNLDVKLSYKDGETFREVEPTTTVLGNHDLWEPGHVEYAVLKVENAGTLALKYKLGINIANETGSTNVDGDPFKLSDYIKFAVLEGETDVTDRAALVAEAEAADSKLIKEGYTKENNLLAKVADATENPSEIVTLVVWMPESVGNEANHKPDVQAPVINLGINVAATQLNHESDSIDNKYDENATYPALSQDELSNVIETGAKDITLGSGNYSLYNVNNGITQNTTLSITGAGPDKTTFSVANNENPHPGLEYDADYSYENSDVTFKNVTISMQTRNFNGFIRAKSLCFENCVIKGMGSYWGVGNVTFKNCTFEDNGNYNLWTYSGKEFTFDGCTFESSIGKFVNAYKTQRDDATLTFKNCNFKYTGTETPSKPAVCLKSSANMIWNATFIDCTSNAATDSGTGSNLYSIESGMNAGTTVKIDDNVVWENGAKK